MPRARAARCQARTDGPEHRNTAGGRAGHHTDEVIPASVRAGLAPAAQKSAKGCAPETRRAVIVCAFPGVPSPMTATSKLRKTRQPRAWRARRHGALGLLRMHPASGAHTNTSDRRVSGPENQLPAPELKNRCRAILKNRETRLSSRRRPYGCQHLLAQYCSSRPDKTLSWAASSRFRAARRARYAGSTGARLHYPCRPATVSSPSTTGPPKAPQKSCTSR